MITNTIQNMNIPGMITVGMSMEGTITVATIMAPRDSCR
ncbi:hypothetical protein AU15_17195 [Marinobacter salarius]|uniref:Uncharacterized protein n=1 Tax=Marinobacter salarius TaxID=1420917 RepID=W5YVP7_9GAMM|nr:hypothetical protein AU15_17195 [Marinobacter salarius]